MMRRSPISDYQINEAVPVTQQRGGVYGSSNSTTNSDDNRFSRVCFCVTRCLVTTIITMLLMRMFINHNESNEEVATKSFKSEESLVKEIENFVPEEVQNVQDEMNEYLLPDIASRYIDETDIKNYKTEEDIQLLINELYARHGHAFKDANKRQYFEAKTWYKADANKSDDDIVAEFNKYERANKIFLCQKREELRKE